jgi:hypothetical protein
MANGSNSIGVAVVAGAAGGMAEVIWIAAAAVVLGTDGWAVARGVFATIVPDMAAVNAAPWFGLFIHFALSIVLAAAFAQTLGRRLRGAQLFFTALATLAVVWAFNFLVLLPLLNPAFVSLLPHPITLVSKLLFGVAMAAVLARPSALAESGARR